MWSLFITAVLAGIRLPEEFNVEKDFNDKEKWIHTKRDIRCDVCKLTVSHAYDKVEFTEDSIYDFVATICDKESLYKEHVILDKPWRVEEAPEQDFRDDVEKRWQAHAMQEACGDFVQPYDDEIKDIFLRSQKKNKKKYEKAPNFRDAVALDVCKSIGVCASKKGTQQEL